MTYPNYTPPPLYRLKPYGKRYVLMLNREPILICTRATVDTLPQPQRDDLLKHGSQDRLIPISLMLSAAQFTQPITILVETWLNATRNPMRDIYNATKWSRFCLCNVVSFVDTRRSFLGDDCKSIRGRVWDRESSVVC